MSLQKKEDIITQWARSESDTGSCEVQVALLTDRIKHLTEHMKVHKKDFHSRYGLLVLVGRRKSLLKYLNKTSPDRYKKLIQALGLRH